DPGPATVADGSDSPAADRTVDGGQSADVPPARIQVPRFLGDYELLEEIGRGGMAVVHRARQIKLDRFVALKLIRDASLASFSELRRFRIEAEVIARLDHPNIVPIYEVGQAGDQPFFSMRLIDGQNMGRHVSDLKARPRDAARLMIKVA